MHFSGNFWQSWLKGRPQSKFQKASLFLVVLVFSISFAQAFSLQTVQAQTTPDPTPSPTRLDAPYTQEATFNVDNYSDSRNLVALSNDAKTGLVGSPHTGTVSVFNYNGNVWQQAASIVSPNPNSDDWFGNAVSLSDDGKTALIGVPNRDIRDGTQRLYYVGTAYIYTFDGTNWTKKQELSNPDLGNYNRFGYSVKLSGDGLTAAIATYNQTYGVANKLYVYRLNNNNWEFKQTIVNPGSVPGDDQDSFGKHIGISDDGNVLLMGAPDSNFAFIFTFDVNSWILTAELPYPSITVSLAVGQALALSGDGKTALVLGLSPSEEHQPFREGYIYRKSATSWYKQSTITPPMYDEFFGYAATLSADGNIALVGGPLPSHQTSHIFEYFANNNGGWSTGQIIEQPGVDSLSTGIGSSLAMTKDGVKFLTSAGETNKIFFYAKPKTMPTVTFTATPIPNDPNKRITYKAVLSTPYATGTIAFKLGYNGTSPLKSPYATFIVPVKDGVATYVTNIQHFPAAASYSGDAKYNPSISNTLYSVS